MAVAVVGPTVALSFAVITRLQVRAQYSTIHDEVALIESHLPSDVHSPLTHLGIVEALSNAVLHGALQVSSEARNDGRFVEWLEAIEVAEAQRPNAVVQVTIESHDTHTEITLFDGGPGFDWRNASVRRGRGLQLIEQCFAHIHFNHAGNQLHLLLNQSSRTL